MVYVLNKDGQPLMPTKRHGKVRRMLRDGQAEVVRLRPFTIRLLYEAGTITQPVTLGIDAGSKHIGFSATTEREELLSGQVETRDDINRNLASRRGLRRTRRGRKTRYRKPRFNNRTHSKKKGWLAPSVRAKCDLHVSITKKIMTILPITDIRIEMAPFDTQKLKADLEGMKRPEREEYQHGESEGYDNIKAYVKWRDGYACAVCGAEHVPLEVHHRKQRKDGGSSRPANLITVCSECHAKYHAGLLKGKKAAVMMPPGPDEKERRPMAGAAFMGIMRWAVREKLLELGVPVKMTYGYKTARVREDIGLEKDHRVDARVISGHPKAAPAEEWFFCKKVRCNNRQIYKQKILPGGILKRNQAPHEVKGFRLYDRVSCGGKEGFVFGRRSSGYMDIRNLSGDHIHKSASYKNIRLLEPAKTLLVERRTAVSSHDLSHGSPTA